MKTILLTAFTLVAFAANSFLCRMALGGELIDPVSFTTLRLVSGAVALWPIALFMAERGPGDAIGHAPARSLRSAIVLFAYAIAFSLAYVTLSTGIGALILFGSAQITMIAAAILAGNRPSVVQWVGSAIALGGLAYLAVPGQTAPDVAGALLMLTAGVAWGLYSLAGKSSAAPVARTSRNFLWTVPLALGASLLARDTVHLEPQGVVLALISGIVTSGLGYVLWYTALKGLTTTQASVVQLLVPVIAAAAGVVFLAEQVTMRLVLASALILGGVALTVVRPTRR